MKDIKYNSFSHQMCHSSPTPKLKKNVINNKICIISVLTVPMQCFLVGHMYIIQHIFASTKFLLHKQFFLPALESIIHSCPSSVTIDLFHIILRASKIVRIILNVPYVANLIFIWHLFDTWSDRFMQTFSPK